MYCRKCGYKNEDDAKYCRKCGTYIWVEEPVEEPVKEEISEEPVEKKTMLPEEPIQQEQRTNASEDKQEKPAEEMQTPGTKEREESRDKKEQEAEDKTEKGKVPQNMWQPDEHLEPIETKIDGIKEKSRVPAIVICIIGVARLTDFCILCGRGFCHKQYSSVQSCPGRGGGDLVEFLPTHSVQTCILSALMAC